MASTSPHPTSARRIRPARSLIALGALGILLLTGCGGSASTSDGSASGTALAPASVRAGSAPGAPRAPGVSGVSGAKSSPGSEAGGPEAQSAVPAASDGSAATSKAGAVTVGGPKLTKSASLELSVKDISAAAARVRAVAAGLQAQVLSEQIGSGGPSDPMPLQGKSTAVSGVGGVSDINGINGVGTLTLSVPASKLDTALDQLARIGTVRQRTTSSQDVTAQYVDTQSRLKTMRASVERVRALMSQAKDLGQVVVLESELSRRESDLESLESQLSVLQNSVEMSPVTVILSTPERKPVTSTGFFAGLRSGWDAFTASTTGLVTVVGAVLPFAVFLSVIGAGVVWWLRRRHTGSAAQGGH